MLLEAVPAVALFTPPASTSVAVAAAALTVGLSLVPVMVKTALVLAVAEPSVTWMVKESVTLSEAVSAWVAAELLSST